MILRQIFCGPKYFNENVCGPKKKKKRYFRTPRHDVTPRVRVWLKKIDLHQWL